MNGISAGLTAFREGYVNAGALNAPTFNDFEARKLRYALYWAYFQNTAYRDINTWAAQFRADFGLYKHTRNIYNPAFRLAKFWQSHLLNGTLDPLAGNGKEIQSALPILINSPLETQLRAGIAQCWQDSNWQVRKDIFTLQGSVFGDIALRVIDDTQREKVYLSIVHPGTIKSVTLDAFGNVKAYTMEYARARPTDDKQTVTYREEAFRDGDDVVYQTFLDDKLFAWAENVDENGKPVAEWRIPYGFIPLVVTQHVNVGLKWGWSEYHATRTKIQELDDLASILHDQMRKTFNSPWLLAGVNPPRDNVPPRAANTGAGVQTNSKNKWGSDSGAEREEIPLYYGPTGASATPLVAPLDLAAAGEEIDRLIHDIEEDHPELRVLKLMLNGEVSGRALALARQPAEDEVNLVRPNYDDALVRAQMMALSIGGYRGYENYTAFDLDSYGAGKLNHYIGQRRVFAQTPFDVSEEKTAFYSVFKAALDAGAQIPRKQVWTEAGYDEEKIAEMETELQAQMDASVSAALQDVITGANQ